VRNEFLPWLRDHPVLEEVRIPRWLRGVEDSVLNCSLHTFCDASKAAYAAAVLFAQNTIRLFKFSWYRPNHEGHQSRH